MNPEYKIYKDKNIYVVVFEGKVLARRTTKKEGEELISELAKASEKATEQVNKILGVNF